MRRPVVLLVALLATFLTLSRPQAASAPACEFDGVGRIVAIGDIHGAYTQFIDVLKVTGLVDANLHWAGGKTHVVQTGDLLDRGPDSRKILDYVRTLAPEAAAAGGALHTLIGNHEEMRLIGDLRYVSAAEFQAFVTPNSEALRQQVMDSIPAADRDRLLGNAPLGMIELIQAFGPTAEYGALIRQWPTVVKINGIVFLHGGISPATASMTCTEINETVRRELTEELPATKASPGTSLAGRADGPLWYRGLAQEPETFAPQVDAIVQGQHASAIVVGHTAAGPDERISMRFGGKVFLIDTGINSTYVPTGHLSALEIQNGTFTAIYPEGRKVLKGTNSLSLSRRTER
jgi:hypothetical protein